MNKNTLIILAIIIVVAIIGFYFYKTGELNNSQSKDSNYMVTLKTNFGEIKFKTYSADAPKTVENFIGLANKGFYNGLIFHRVVKDFMIQGGDPLCSAVGPDKGVCGTGGPGYQFEDELNKKTDSYKEGYVKGVVAMANSGQNTNGSQFFIMLEDVVLPHNYTIFGKVVSGQDVVDKIGSVETILVGNDPNNPRPASSVIIESVLVSQISE